MTKQQKGFSIIELMVVVAITAAATIVGFYYLMQEHSDSRQEAYAIESAHRFLRYSEAIRSHLVSNLDSIPVDTRYHLGYGVLAPVDMPEDFAPCPSGEHFGCSMWGNAMRSWGIRDGENDDVFRAVIAWRTTFNEAEAIRTGLDVDEESMAVTYEYIAKWVANVAEKEFGLVAGYLPADSQTAILVNNRQTVDISAYETSTRNYARPVIFYGWPEFGQHNDDSSNNNNNGGGTGINSECRIAQASYLVGRGWESGFCTGEFIEAASFPVCRAVSGSTYTMGYDGATISQAAFRATIQSNSSSGNCSTCTNGYTDRITYNQLTLNRTLLDQYECEYVYWTDDNGTRPPRQIASPPFPDASVVHRYCCTEIED